MPGWVFWAAFAAAGEPVATTSLWFGGAVTTTADIRIEPEADIAAAWSRESGAVLPDGVTSLPGSDCEVPVAGAVRVAVVLASEEAAAGCVESVEGLGARVGQLRTGGAEVVVALVDWGDLPLDEGALQASHALMEDGVDVLVGYRGDGVRPVEVYETTDGRRTVIAHGMGALSTADRGGYVYGLHPDGAGDPRDGLWVSVRAVRVAYGRDVERVQLAELVVGSTWSEPGDGGVVTVDVVAALAAVDEALAIETSADALVALHRRRALLVGRQARVRGVVGEHLFHR